MNTPAAAPADVHYDYIEHDTKLRSAAAEWSNAQVVGLDTEFVRERTYFPLAGLVQLHANSAIHLVDCVSVADMAPLTALLDDHAQTKVLHSAGEDLQVFAVLCDTVPRPLFDTQVAAAFAGLGAGLAYHRLAQEICGVELAKDQTRSNWRARPLAEKQLEYAALDVLHLPAIHQSLAERLKTRGYAEWCAEETDRLMSAALATTSPDNAYIRVKGAARLSPRHQHVLKALATWRETEAAARDVPRSHLMRDPTLVEFTKNPPRSMRELRDRDVMHPAAVRKFGPALLEFLSTVSASDTDKDVAPLLRQLDTRGVADKIARMQTLVEQRATDLDLPAPLLARKRDLEWLAFAPLGGVDGAGVRNPVLTGWRYDVIGAKLEELALAQ